VGGPAAGVTLAPVSTVDADSPFRRVVTKACPEAELLRTWPLEGGVSAQITALEISRPGGRTEKLVVRQYGDTNVRANPNAAEDEFRLLEIVRAAGVPAPRPLMADSSGQILPRPYLVITLVEGQSGLDSRNDIRGQVRELAGALARIHGIPHGGASFLGDKNELFSRKLGERPARLDESLNEGDIRAALARIWPPVAGNEPAVLHGDFWPGNTLWRGGRLAAVIDWEDAGIGDPLTDLANGRLEIAMFHGQDAMREFTGRYRSLMPSADYTNLPCWDLCAALHPAGQMESWGFDAATLARLRDGHRAFVVQALDALPS
jgi:aminoglycoside phosphotransferase (APT) family kinase protein